MKTSIIIPVKDDTYIFNCLKSILNNFNNKIPKNKEIIVIDDKKSKQKFSVNLENFCKSNKIKYFKAKEPGASFNRNYGIDVSYGEKILFIHSDCTSDKKWIFEMEKSLDIFDIVEGQIIYNSKIDPLFDRVVQNKQTKYNFLTANMGIKRAVTEKCRFDKRFIVFREDTDFGLCALENGFKGSFNKKARVFHRSSRFTIKRFIIERKRYIGEPLFLKKHKKNPLIKKHVKSFLRIAYPFELIFLIAMLISLFLDFRWFLFFYLFPGFFYCLKNYLVNKRTFKIKDTLLILLLLPLTMFIKRVFIWRGAIKFKFFLI